MCIICHAAEPASQTAGLTSQGVSLVHFTVRILSVPQVTLQGATCYLSLRTSYPNDIWMIGINLKGNKMT